MGSTARERILERANAIGVVEEPKPETTAKDRILSRAQQMGEIKTVEPMQQRSRQRSAADDLPDIAAFGAGNYGADKRVFGEDYNVGQGLAKAGQMGLTQVAKAGSSAGAWLENLLGDFAREGTNGYWDPDTSKWLFNRWNKAIDAEAEGVQQRYAENTRRGGKAAQVLEDVGAATVAAAPQAVAAILTGGASTAATAEQLAARAAASQGVMGTISRTMQTMGRDPNFKLAFAQVAGPGYEQAKADGADDLRASLYAIGNGLLNAAVEAGGGIQTLPNELKGGASAWKAWVDSMLDEGKEEAVQGVIERAMQNTMYGKDNPLVGVGKGAVLDPAAAAEEFAGGAVVGGLLGGGQIGVQQLLGRAGRGNGALSAAQEQGQAQEVTFDPQTRNAAESRAEGNAGVNENGLASLTEQEKINLSSGAKNKVVTTFQDAVQFVRNALKDKGNVDRAYLGKVPESTARRVMQETGVDIDGYNAIIPGDSVRHMFKHHGDPILETARGQIAVSPEAVARIPEILSAPDKVTLSAKRDASGRPALIFEKIIGNQYITVQAVSTGTHSLQADTLYIRKRTPQDTVSNTGETPALNSNVRNVPPQESFIPDTTVPQGAADVNAQDMRNGGEYARENSPVQGAEHSRQQEGGTVAPLGVSATQESDPSVTHGPMDGNRLGEILAQIKNGRMDAVSAYDRLGGEMLTKALESGAYGMDANDRLYRIDPQEHIDARDANNVGKRAMHAFQFDHPELHRYYQEVAEELLEELDRVQRGGEIIKTQDSEPPFQERYFRTRRYAPENVERLLDDYEMSYKDIRRALEAIVNDKGQENFAAAKRVELLIDGMLENGYKSIYDGAQVAPNADYIRLKGDIPGAVEQSADNGSTPAQPQNDGLCGADRGSLNSRFQNMQMESDTFHPVNPRAEERLRNEQGRAPSEVPEVNPDTKQNISKTVSTILNAPITSNEMAPVLEQSVADGRFDYAPVTDQAAMDRANGAIARNGGYQKAAGIFTAKVELGQRVTKDDFALGVQCYNEAVAAGDAAMALELAGDLADAARTGAQVTQAVNLLNRLTPAGKLLTLRRYVDKMNRQSRPSRGRRGDGLAPDERKALFVEEASTYAIDEQLATDYMMAETDEARAEAWQAIISDIASRVRPTVLEKWNAWRYTAMLTNPVTHVRNLAGNGVQALLRKTKNAVGTAIEAATVRNTDQRTKALLGRNAEDMARRELAAELYQQDKGLAMGAGKYTEGSSAGIAREIEDARKMFGEKYAIGRGVQAVSDWNSAALDWGDALFNKPAYIESLAQTMKARGITAEEARGGAKADLMQSAREYAAREAAKATYRDFNTFSDMVSRLNRLKQSDNRGVRIAGHAADAVLPFRRTPANILVRGVVDYSPVSFARVLAHDIRAVRNGSMTAPEMIDHIASGLTGTGILLLGYMLAKNGLLHTKAGDDDREENFLKSVGYQDFALQIGDVSYTLDWMVPAAMPLFAGAALAEGASGDKRTADALGDALAGISDVVLETSMLSSLDQIMNGMSYAESKPWYLLSSALTNYISQGVPTIGGKAANILDDTVRKAYVPSDAGEVSSDIQYFWQSLMRKVPGGRNTLQPSVDVWGQEISNGSTAERLAESLVSPGFISVAQNDAVTTEVRRLAEKVGSGVYPSKAAKSFQVEGETVYLDGDRYTAYAKALGQNRHKMLEQAMKLPGYKSMKSADKADLISTMYEYANAKAKKAVAPKYTMTKAMEKYAEAEKAGISPAEWYMLRGGMDTDGNGSVNQKEAKTALDRAGLTRQEKAALWLLISAGWKNNPYK